MLSHAYVKGCSKVLEIYTVKKVSLIEPEFHGTPTPHAQAIRYLGACWNTRSSV